MRRFFFGWYVRFDMGYIIRQAQLPVNSHSLMAFAQQVAAETEHIIFKVSFPLKHGLFTQIYTWSLHACG